ncbi:MAG: hypothetical protein DMD97_24195 [Candidatus Rokuibacteriota bacterium]|nr:MAG: hypothetical protein DMD97_24195 [Candidatus Rokubacteria bacterium]
MPRPFALPDLGEGLTEAEIVKVLVGEGDVVAEDAPLLEVETDKATVEIPSPFAGRVARVHIQPGQTVKVGEVLVTFDDSSVASAGQGRGGGGRGRGLDVPAHPRRRWRRVPALAWGRCRLRRRLDGLRASLGLSCVRFGRRARRGA